MGWSRHSVVLDITEGVEYLLPKSGRNVEDVGAKGLMGARNAL